MQAQSAISRNTQGDNAIIIESLLEQAQDTLFKSNDGTQPSDDKVVMLNTAKKYAEDVLAIDNLNSDAHHILALSHTLLGESSRAKKHIAKAFELSEPSITLQLEKAHIDLAAGHYNKAESGFLKVLEQDSANADAFLGMAITKQKKKDWGAAFLHYNSLISKGLFSQPVATGIAAVVPFIDVDYWSDEYQNTVLTALSALPEEAAGFARVCNSLLIQKYDLERADSQLDFAALIDDPLLQAVIDHKFILTPEVEQLVCLLRETLLIQICDSRELPALAQSWVIGLAECAVYYGFSWPVSEQETLILTELANAIRQESNSRIVENSVGAVLLYAMYEELYSAPFSYKILGAELNDWPAGMRALMASSLYEPATLHSLEIELKQVISPSHSSLVFEREPQAPFPKWTQIEVTQEQSATEFLLDTFGPAVPLKANRKRPLNILVSSTGTGKNALHQAAQFNDVNLVGADTSIAKLAFAEYQARNLEIDNVRWVQCAENKLTCLNQRFDIVDWSTTLNRSANPAETLDYIKKLMAKTGIAKLRVELNQDNSTENLLKQLAITNHLEPNIMTLRSVRRAIIEDSNKQDWLQLFGNPAFYHTGAGMDILFGPAYKKLNHPQVEELLNEADLKLLGICDKFTGNVHKANSLYAWLNESPLTIETPKSLVLFVKLA